jgi:hypothetical protein
MPFGVVTQTPNLPLVGLHRGGALALDVADKIGLNAVISVEASFEDDPRLRCPVVLMQHFHVSVPQALVTNILNRFLASERHSIDRPVGTNDENVGSAANEIDQAIFQLWY